MRRGGAGSRKLAPAVGGLVSAVLLLASCGAGSGGGNVDTEPQARSAAETTVSPLDRFTATSGAVTEAKGDWKVSGECAKSPTDGYKVDDASIAAAAKLYEGAQSYFQARLPASDLPRKYPQSGWAAPRAVMLTSNTAGLRSAADGPAARPLGQDVFANANNAPDFKSDTYLCGVPSNGTGLIAVNAPGMQIKNAKSGKCLTADNYTPEERNLTQQQLLPLQDCAPITSPNSWDSLRQQFGKATQAWDRDGFKATSMKLLPIWTQGRSLEKRPAMLDRYWSGTPKKYAIGTLTPSSDEVCLTDDIIPLSDSKGTCPLGFGPSFDQFQSPSDKSKCLNAWDNGSLKWDYSCNWERYQGWQLAPQAVSSRDRKPGSDTFFISNPTNGLCVSLYNGVAEPTHNLIQDPCDNRATQMFNFYSDGTIHPLINNGLCAYSAGGGFDQRYSANFRLDNCVNPEQGGYTDWHRQWKYEQGQLTLKADSTICLSIARANALNNGAAVRKCDSRYGNTATALLPVPTGWELFNSSGGLIRASFNYFKCLDVKNGQAQEGTEVQTYDCYVPAGKPDNSAQQWSPRNATAVDGGQTAQLKSGLGEFCLNRENDGTVRIRGCNATSATQQWFIPNRDRTPFGVERDDASRWIISAPDLKWDLKQAPVTVPGTTPGADTSIGIEGNLVRDWTADGAQASADCKAKATTAIACRVTRVGPVNPDTRVGMAGVYLWTLPVRLNLTNNTDSEFAASSQAQTGDSQSIGSNAVNLLPSMGITAARVGGTSGQSPPTNLISIPGVVESKPATGSLGWLRIFDLGNVDSTSTGQIVDSLVKATRSSQDQNGSTSAESVPVISDKPWSTELTIRVYDKNALEQSGGVAKCLAGQPDPNDAEYCGNLKIKLSSFEEKSYPELENQAGLTSYRQVQLEIVEQDGPAADFCIGNKSKVANPSGAGGAPSLGNNGFIDLNLTIAPNCGQTGALQRDFSLG